MLNGIKSKEEREKYLEEARYIALHPGKTKGFKTIRACKEDYFKLRGILTSGGKVFLGNKAGQECYRAEIGDKISALLKQDESVTYYTKKGEPYHPITESSIKEYCKAYAAWRSQQ